MKTEKTDNLRRFQGVIDFVNKTGVGYRRFLFNANVGYDELVNSKGGNLVEFPIDHLIIKISDGKTFLGSIIFSQLDWHENIDRENSILDRERDIVIKFKDIGGRILGMSRTVVNITLHFETLKDVGKNAGYAIVEVMPSDPEKLKQWYSETVSAPKLGWFASFLKKIWK